MDASDSAKVSLREFIPLLVACGRDMMRAGVARPEGMRGVVEAVLAVSGSTGCDGWGIPVSGRIVPAHECKLTSRSRHTSELGGVAYSNAE